MQLRPVADGEYDLAVNVAESCRYLMPGICDTIPSFDIQAIRSTFKAPGCDFWVMEANGSLIGTIAFRSVGNTLEWHIEHLYLLSGWRKMGIGRMMVEKVVEQCRAEGARRISVTLHTDCVAAISLFRSLRFQFIGDYDMSEYSGEVQLRRVFV